MVEEGRNAAIASWLLFAASALAPLPFGSNEPVAIAFWCVVLGLCIICAPVRDLQRGQFVALGVAGVVIAAYGLVLHEQLADRPWFGAYPPIWHDAETALGVPLRPSVSIARNEPWFELGRPLVCILAMVSGLLVGTQYRRALQLLNVVAWSGTAYAVYGVMVYLIDPSKILWRDKEAYQDSVTGTFVNRNTAAVYFGSCAIVCLLLMCRRVRSYLGSGSITWQKVQHRIFDRTRPSLVAALAMVFLCLTAMFMTRSRAGVLLSLVALIGAFALYFRRDLPGRFGVLATLLGGTGLALVLLQLMGGGVNARFDAQGAADEGRLATWRETLRLIADHPWFGTGEGTFVWSFPTYRSADVSMKGVWDHAHSTLLEVAADMGIPFAGLLTLVWILIFAVLIRAVSVRQRDLLIPTCALSIAMVANTHSLIDFSLQIPGYSIPALALIGIGLARSLTTDRKGSPAKKRASTELLLGSPAGSRPMDGAVNPAA